MINKSKILNSYNKKIKLLDTYNKFYYEKSSPKVTDEIFDKLKEEIQLLEKKHDFLKSKNSPSKIVGYKPSKNFKKDLHRIPMLSLANAFTEEDLIWKCLTKSQIIQIYFVMNLKFILVSLPRQLMIANQ